MAPDRTPDDPPALQAAMRRELHFFALYRVFEAALPPICTVAGKVGIWASALVPSSAAPSARMIFFMAKLLNQRAQALSARTETWKRAHT